MYCSVRSPKCSAGESHQQHCHKTRRTLMSPQECKIARCTKNQFEMRPSSMDPGHTISSVAQSFHLLAACGSGIWVGQGQAGTALWLGWTGQSCHLYMSLVPRCPSTCSLFLPVAIALPQSSVVSGCHTSHIAAALQEGKLQEGFSSVQFSRSVVSDSLPPHESQHARPPCPSPTSGVYSNSCPLSRYRRCKY